MSYKYENWSKALSVLFSLQFSVSVLGRPQCWLTARGVICSFPCRTSDTNILAMLCVHVCECKLDCFEPKSSTDSAIFATQFFPAATSHLSGQLLVIQLMIEITGVINRLDILQQIRKAVLARSRYGN